MTRSTVTLLLLTALSLLALADAPNGSTQLRGSIGLAPTPAEVASIEMSPSSLTLTVENGGARIVATARDANGAVIPNVTFYWESRDTRIATVDQSGLVTGLAAGSTTVVAIAPNGRHRPATVTVLAATPTPTPLPTPLPTPTPTPTPTPSPTPAAEVASIEMSPNSLTLTVGDGGARIVATARDANGAVIPNVTFYWDSRDTRAARVDQSGLVTGVAAGSTTVVGVAPNGRHSPATVTVLAATPTPTPTPAPSAILPSGPLTRLRVPLIPIGSDTNPKTEYDYQKTGPRVVLKFGPTDYRMWYEGVYAPNTANCVYATSTDGINWTKYGVVSAPSGGDELEVSPHTIIFEDNVFKMWYHAFSSIDEHRRIKYAESADGINWTKLGVALNVGSPGSADDNMVAEPRVFHLSDGSYRMYYVSENVNLQGVGIFPLTYATSADGRNWTKTYQVLFGEHDSGYGIVRDGAMWYMWYGNEWDSLGFAYSNDGLTWIDGPNNPVLFRNADPNALDGWGLGDSVSAYRDGNEFRVMYTGLAKFNGVWIPEQICMARIMVTTGSSQ